MNRWAVLDLEADPTPGDPVRVGELAGRLGEQAELARGNTGRLRRLAGDGGLGMAGDYAPRFRDVLDELPGELAKLEKAYAGASRALSAFAGSLAEAKTRSGRALHDGRDAAQRLQGALREIRAALPAEREVLVGSGLGLNETVLDTAMLGLDEATRTQVRDAARRARAADADRDAARRLADQAAELRGDAEDRCVEGIYRALEDSGIQNKSFLEKAWDTVSAPFRSWDDFVELCKTVALVAGVVAMFLSGPVGWALMAAAIVAGAVVLADSLGKYARGEASLGEVALNALGVIPGGRGVASLAKLGMAARGLARAVAGGAGRLTGRSLGLVGARVSDLASVVPKGQLKALHAGSADPAVLKSVFRRHYGDVTHVNAPRFATGVRGFNINCSRCVLATDSTLAGVPASAAPIFDKVGTTRDIAKVVGRRWRSASGYDDIVSRMHTSGVGSRGIVAVDRGPGQVGHVFNVVHDTNGVVFIDGQVGRFATLESFHRLSFLPTT